MKLIFAGTPNIAAQALRMLAAEHEVVLAITREDAPIGRKRIITPSPVAEAAAELDIPVLKRNRIGTEDLAVLGASGAELAIVVAYGALIPKAALELLKWWNLHFSLLPKWRGAAPLQYSIMKLGDGAGISLFELEEGLDTGPIIASKAMNIDPSKTYGEHLDQFTIIGCELILDAISELPTPRAQLGEPSFAPKLTREIAKLDFTEPAQLVAAKVMALNPEPVAFGYLNQEPLRILQALSLGTTDWADLDGSDHCPGRVIAQGSKIFLECGAGTRVELRQVQPSGKKVMSAGDWYRGIGKEVILD